MHSQDTVIVWRLRGVHLLGLPLPRLFFGSMLASCRTRHGRYVFHIEAHLPVLGLLVAYRGWLEVVDEH